MKKALLLLSIFALAACDNNKPKYDVLLSCEDGAEGRYLVEAKVYETKADLVITRLDKELRKKQWLAGHLWLYNKLPLIDDKIKMSLPAKENFSVYEERDHVRLEMSHDNLSGGVDFSLWHASDNNLTLNDGEEIPDGYWMLGTPCKLVVDRKVANYGDMTPEEIKKMKNCCAYIDSQNWTDTVAPGMVAYRVRDEDSGREMFMSGEQMNVITNGVELHRYSLMNIQRYLGDAKYSCEIATRLKNYIKEHIDKDCIKESAI